MAENFPSAFGEYRLLRKLAQGGMAEIFLAQDKKGEICAIKRILPHLAHEESFIRMFIDEARIVSHLDHPNIAGVFDQGKIDGYYYIGMEFVQGHSLLTLSERAKTMKIPLPRGLLAYVVAELLAGLGFAHSARDQKGRHLGIVHRDVTPQNVLISYDGEVKLIDFGVAKARARLTQTEAGFTKGKLAYMSPEQARGEELDGRSDLFSVGIILHEITTNSRLFNKEGPGGILGAIVNDPIPPPSLKAKDYPKELEGVLMRALDKDVGRRWQTAEEMREALLRFSKKEKPVPGRSRLKDLVHDLFGEPESQKWIQAAKQQAEPTPASIPVHAERPASIKVKGSEVNLETKRPKVELKPPPEPKEKPEQETRMFRADIDVRKSDRIEQSRDITGEVPAVSVVIPKREAPVPVPKVSLRERLARFLLRLAEDLRLSWRNHRRRWIAGATAFIAVLGLSVAAWAGAIGWTLEGLGSLKEDLREAKVEAGLTEQARADAGVTPTVLRVLSDPPGAAIAVNGVGMGTVTPSDLDSLPTGRELSLELSLPGYRGHKSRITLLPNVGLTEQSYRLERLLGTLVLDSEPSGATIWLNGKDTGKTTPATLEGLSVDAPLNVKLSKRGYVSQSKVLVATDSEARREYFDLVIDEGQIPPGTLVVRSNPSGCAVSVDDRPAGVTPLDDFEVKAGPHMVEVRCENYAPDTRAVVASPRQKSELQFILRPTVFGYLTVRAQPPEGTRISINGQDVPMPVEWLKVIPGNHRVVITNDRLNVSRELSVDVPPNARISRTVELFR